LFPQVPVGTPVRITNEPVKTAFVNGELLLEAHPPVDAEGQTYEPNLDLFSQLLDKALGPTTAAVHWDFAREALQKADGMPAVVGLEADLDPAAPAQADGSAPQQPGTSTVNAVLTPSGSQTEATQPPTAAAPGSVGAPSATQGGASHIASAGPDSSMPAEAAAPVHDAAAPAQRTPVPAEPAPLPPPDSSTPSAAKSGARSFPVDKTADATASPTPSP